MERIISKKAFMALLCKKPRNLEYTRHSISRARKRELISEDGETVPEFERDLLEGDPRVVVEQDSEGIHERKFKAYYRSPSGGFVVYIFVLNDQTRLISVYRTSKKIQEAVYNCERKMVRKRK